MEDQLQQRSAVKEELKWDLSAIFKTEEDYKKAVTALLTEVERFALRYDGHLNESGNVIEAIRDYEKIEAGSSHVFQYKFLPVTVDITDSQAQEESRYVSNILAELNAKLSFFNSQIEDLDDSVLNDVSELAPEFKPFIRLIKTAKQNKLHPKAEEALAFLDPVLDSFAEIFEQSRLADADFGSFEVNGTVYPLSFVLYEEEYMYHQDPLVRRVAYDQFNKVLSQYKNTIATAYYNQVQKEKTLATMRGYDSVFDYLLADQEVSQELYNRQIDTIMTDFAPVMRKYITHLKDVHGLDKMTYADLKIDLDPEFNASMSIEEFKGILPDVLSVLGNDYVEMINRAFPERWIDFAQNKGKESGAFCSPTYGKQPFILVNWSGQLADAYTLFHELGHAGQGLLSNEKNTLTGSDPSLYLIEAPSTFNELLLTDYLRSKTEDPRMERNVIALMISQTYFHNFVTHLLEAAYQREVYRLIDAGKSFDASKLGELKRRVLEDFWGDAVELEEGAELTWMRQSHYYMGLYPYTYSAGLTIATQAFLNIKEGETDASGWMEFLAMGGEKIPVDAAKVAGVDITTDKPLQDTIRYLNESVDRMIELTHVMK